MVAPLFFNKHPSEASKAASFPGQQVLLPLLLLLFAKESCYCWLHLAVVGAACVKKERNKKVESWVTLWCHQHNTYYIIVKAAFFQILASALRKVSSIGTLVHLWMVNMVNLWSLWKKESTQLGKRHLPKWFWVERFSRQHWMAWQNKSNFRLFHA